MVKMKVSKLAKYEEKDPLWWCQHHKNTTAQLALRLEQVLNGKTDLDPICRVLIDNVKTQNGIVWEYWEDET